MTVLDDPDFERAGAAERAPARPRWWQRLARGGLHRRLRRIEHGALTLVEDWPGGGRREFGLGSDDLRCAISVRRPRAYTAIARGGIIGAAASYIEGDWAADDLAGLIRLSLRNEAAMVGVDSGLARVADLLRRIWHRGNANTKRGSRRNVAAHYDLSNEFFELMLDPTMTYSCALFDRPSGDLQSAQLAKLDRLCRKLDLGPDDHLLEIGTGWGSMALHAASNYGCRVTTTTISRRQFELASRRVAEAGLGDRVTVLQQDYRDLRGQYDKLVSVEMIEAVGHRYLRTFVERCSSLLRRDGLMALQAITIADQSYESAVRRVDFIKRYVFPGSFIPSVTAITAAARRASDLRVVHLEDMTPHYAETLRRWRDNLRGNRARVRRLGLDTRFERLWEFYLCYCEAGFDERFLGSVQMLLAKPACRRAPLLPHLEAAG